MKKYKKFVPLFMLIAVSLACQLLPGDASTPYPTYTPFPTYTPEPNEEDISEPFPFATTKSSFPETGDVEDACLTALGPGWRIADWNDISEYVAAGNPISEFLSHIGDFTQLWVTYNRNGWYSEQRHYFIEAHQGTLPEGWLSHADFDEHNLDLGSWYDLELSVLCYQSDAPATIVESAEALSDESPEAPQTPDAPPTFELGFVGTQSCGEWPHYAVFEAESTSIWILQSAHFEIFDNTHNQSIYNGNNNRPFLDEGQCPPGNTILPPFNTRFLAANIQEPEAGTEFSAAITLCSEDGTSGECVTEVIDFVFESQEEAALAEPVGDPAFELEYAGYHACGNWPSYAAFWVENTSLHTFESLSLTINDKTNDKKMYGGSNDQGFVEDGGCPPGKSTLPPSARMQVAANVRDPESGAEFEATIKLCTQDGREGECVSHKVIFMMDD